MLTFECLKLFSVHESGFKTFSVVPKCNWATRNTKTESTEIKMRSVRMPAGPIGNQGQITSIVSNLKHFCIFEPDSLEDLSAIRIASA